MNYAGLVQQVGGAGESLYVSTMPNYSPIQSIPPVRSKQENFSGNSENYNRSQLNYYNTSSSGKSKHLSSSYMDRAQEIQRDARAQKASITPGMLLDIVA